jgi:hypothetical protein
MFALLAVLAALAVVGGAALVVLGRSRRFDEVERFHTASRMTSEWSRTALTSSLPAQSAADRDDHAEARRSE